ncbi:MAG TPA: SulP family inorganic anion transporter [Coriobacteriia bacterium]|nr:SulP family inorganic anion transporter [Coriobacteriia bacterium]
MPAIIEAWRAGLFRRESLLRNVIAGLVVGVVALPLAMAFAIASGATPQAGLYTALVAGVVVSLLGGTRVQIAGPTGAFAVLLAGVTARYGIAGLQAVTLMAGVLLLVLGLTKLGGAIRYIPESVVLGFTAGIAVVIWVGQWGNFFGLPKTHGVTLFEKLPNILAALPHLDLPTTLLGVASLVVLIVWPRIPVAGRVPAPVIVLVAGTVFVSVTHPPSIATIGSVFGGIPRGLPPLTLPHLTSSTIAELARPAIAVALLGAIESLLSATVADGMIGTRHDPNQELVGQGVANVAASLLGGFAATGAIARTATSVRHGGDSPVAGIVHAATIALVLVALAPLAANVPLTTLAAILFVVAYNMSEIERVVRIAKRAPASDVGVMLVTFALAALADISLAVEVGVMLAMLNFFRRMVVTVGVSEVDSGQVDSHLAESDLELPEGVLVYSVDGPFFFGAVEQFESALLHTDTDPRAIVLSLAKVPFVDMTGLVALKDAVDALEGRGVEVAICETNEAVAALIERADVRGTVAVDPGASIAEAVAALNLRSQD